MVSGCMMDRGGRILNMVQRYPDYVDRAANDAWDEPELIRGLNEKMGRKFRVISFRWLGKDDV